MSERSEWSPLTIRSRDRLNFRGVAWTPFVILLHSTRYSVISNHVNSTSYATWHRKWDTSPQEVGLRSWPLKRWLGIGAKLARAHLGLVGRLDWSGSQWRVRQYTYRYHLLTLYSLYIPTHIPDLPENWQEEWSNSSFSELSYAILSLFIPGSSIPSTDLKDLINKSYSTFRHDQTTPLRQTGEKEYVMELWHGPTWAFKDVALQFLGNVFAYFLERRNKGKKDGEKEELTVVGATSGDTGS